MPPCFLAYGTPLPTPVYIALIPLIILHMMWDRATAKALVQDWARSNHYEVVSIESKSFSESRFSRATGRFIFRITFKDTVGQTRIAWARCQVWLLHIVKPTFVVEIET